MDGAHCNERSKVVYFHQRDVTYQSVLPEWGFPTLSFVYVQCHLWVFRRLATGAACSRSLFTDGFLGGRLWQGKR